MSKKKAVTQEEGKKKRDISSYDVNFTSIEEFLDKPVEIINVSPTLDSILGGGIPSGSFVVVTGRYKLGKSTMCLHLAAKAQKKGFKVYYFDVEGRLKQRDLRGIPELETDKDKFQIVQSKTGHMLDAEDYLAILLHKLETETRCVMIVDSISQLCSSGRKAADIGDRYRDDVPLMLASLTKQAANILPVNSHILVCITHIIANQGQGHSIWMESSGQKVQYQADVKLKATHMESYVVDDRQVGQKVFWQCDTAALGPPGGKTESLLRYGEGIDEYYDLLSVCIDIGLVPKGGAWLTIGDKKVQGVEKARQFLKDNPDAYEKLAKQFVEAIS